MQNNNTNLSRFPALEEMGITRAHEISNYSLRSDGGRTDILKVSYKRKKGSLLPQSRKYTFGRSLHTVVADGGTARMEQSYEISPFLLKAIAELDLLVKPSEPAKDLRVERANSESHQEIMHDFEMLEKMVVHAGSDVDSAAIAARFARLKVQIAAL